MDAGPDGSDAAGWPHRLLTAGAKEAAVAGSVNRTLADGPMAAHRDAAAATEPRSVGEVPTPRSSMRLTSFDMPDE